MKFEEIKLALGLIESPVERLEMVMDLGKQLLPVPENATCTEILGCSSFVEICRLENNFYARADSAIVRGIVAIIISMVDGKTPAEIKQIDLLSKFQELDLNLGAGRLNGINSMISFLKNL
ncbi:MAG: SufE family protein [Alphaproteobacteria bacterium]|jgi:cysteine desulfuration protein SufE|nr:SufE family protein [Alphaproteobacteria bacterium]